jgi:hypothetical protein
MYSFDASSIILAWDNYPIENEHFESFWNWFADKVETKAFVISEVALREVRDKVPECGRWLKDHHIEVLKRTPSVLIQAQSIKVLLGIEEENYHPKGVGENDLLIIAIAKENHTVLVSEEHQNNIPPTRLKYKIPTVCALPEVNLSCIHFIDLIRE